MEQISEWLLMLLIIGGGVYALSAVVYTIRFSKRTKASNMDNSISESKFLNKRLARLSEGNSEFPVERAIAQLGSSVDDLVNRECGMQNES